MFARILRSGVAYAAVTLLVFVALLVGIVGKLAAGKLHYGNYWGGAVFAPFALLIVGLLIVVLVRAGRTREKPPGKVSGRAARKARQAEATKYPIDEYRKW